MSKAFADIDEKFRPFCHFYMDDVFVATKDGPLFHLQILEELFTVMAEWGLMMKLSKSEFMVKKTLLLGLPIDPYLLHLDEDKVKVIEAFARPATKKELRSFLGIVSYCRIFIPKFALRAALLYKLLTKDIPDKFTDEWTDEHDRAFIDIKGSLAEQTKLSHPDYGPDAEPFFLCVDSSGDGVGYFVSQRQKREAGVVSEMPIAFGTREAQRGV